MVHDECEDLHEKLEKEWSTNVDSQKMLQENFILRKEIDALKSKIQRYEKIYSCEGNDKLKERGDLRPEQGHYRKITSNEQSRLAV